MELSEMKQKKQILETTITRLLNDFQNEIGLNVSSLRFRTGQEFGNHLNIIYKVDVEVLL